MRLFYLKKLDFKQLLQTYENHIIHSPACYILGVQRELLLSECQGQDVYKRQNLSFLQIGFTFGNDSINHLHAILQVLTLCLLYTSLERPLTDTG